MCVLDNYGINQQVCKCDLSYYNQLRAFLCKLCFRDAAICDANDLGRGVANYRARNAFAHVARPRPTGSNIVQSALVCQPYRVLHRVCAVV